MPGWLYIHEVIAYVLGTDEERLAARVLLELAGYDGPGAGHYLYCGGEDAPAVADGRVFKTRTDALKYLKEQNVTAATYFATDTSFPKSIPAEITWNGTAFRVLSWKK